MKQRRIFSSNPRFSRIFLPVFLLVFVAIFSNAICAQTRAEAASPDSNVAVEARIERSLLERMVAQAKEITKDASKAYYSMALLEDVLGIRLSLARDGADREKWEGEYN